MCLNKERQHASSLIDYTVTYCNANDYALTKTDYRLKY